MKYIVECDTYKEKEGKTIGLMDGYRLKFSSLSILLEIVVKEPFRI